MTASQSLKIYELLNEQFRQPDKARQLTEAIESVVDEKMQLGSDQFQSAFRKDLELLKADLLGDLRTEMRDQKFDMIKWHVSLFTATTLMIIGLYLKLSQ